MAATRKKAAAKPLPIKNPPPATAGDLLAAADVLQSINATWDTIDLEDAGELLPAAQVVLAQAKATVSNLQQQMLGRMEKRPEVTIAGRVFRKVRSFKQRARHRDIRNQIMSIALEPDPETGEVLDRHQAVALTAKLMGDMYVAPSALPKIGALKALGYRSLAEVCDEEDVGFTLEVEEIKDASKKA